jgi:2,3-bisphosphoglycerate-dependent phosphoglycerate mutase
MQLVLVRHGESTFNDENRFTGWLDADLSNRGLSEAHAVGRALLERGYVFDIAYTSLLKRSIRSLWIILEELGLVWIPERKEWRLNERHYGALQGLNKAETALLHGADQVRLWRRSFSISPPSLAADDPKNPTCDPRYAAVPAELLPRSESLKDTVDRVLPLWHEDLAPALHSGQRVLICAHGNSLRALAKHLESLSGYEVAALEFPTGATIAYELSETLVPIRREVVYPPDWQPSFLR